MKIIYYTHLALISFIIMRNSIVEEFNCTMSTVKVGTLARDLIEGKKYNLDSEYQRGVVWEDKDRNFFLDSLFKSMIPTNIIFVKDKKQKRYVNVDGKQRCTTIKMYYGNEIPYTLDDVNYYYSKVPEHDRYGKCLTEEERMTIDNHLLFVAEYKDGLNYEQQLRLFEGLNKGKSATAGEKMVSNFKEENSAKMFNKLCDNLEPLFSYLIDTSRDQHKSIILRMVYNYHNKNCAYSSQTIRKQIKRWSEKKQLGKIFSDFEPKIKWLLATIKWKKLTKYTIDTYAETVLVNMAERYDELCKCNSGQLTKVFVNHVSVLRESEDCNYKRTKDNWSSIFEILRNVSLHNIYKKNNKNNKNKYIRVKS